MRGLENNASCLSTAYYAQLKYSIAEGIFIFQYAAVHIFAKYSSTYEERLKFASRKKFLSFLSNHRPVLESLQAVCQRTTQVTYNLVMI